jgi:type IV pilus assembly protein PilN
MIRVNLIGERKLAKKKVAFPIAQQQLPLACGAILVGAVLLVGWRYWSLGHQSARLAAETAKAQKETASLKSIIAQVADFEQQKAELQQRVELIEQLRKEQTGPVHMLDEISRSLPQMLWLTNLKETPNSSEVLIDGRSNTLTGISDFVANLEASGYFRKSIEIVSTVTDGSAAAEKAAAATTGELIKFQIKAVFKTPGDAAKPVAGTAKTQRGN